MPNTLVESRSRAVTEDVAKSISIVRHDDRDRAPLLFPHFGIAVTGILDGFTVESQRDVVDERAPVDLAEIDAALTTVDERVERSGDVVAVDTQIERKVVAGPAGMHAKGILRSAAARATTVCEPSTAGHRQRLSITIDGLLHEPFEIDDRNVCSSVRMTERAADARPSNRTSARLTTPYHGVPRATANSPQSAPSRVDCVTFRRSETLTRWFAGYRMTH
jgi:hypothetical protein